jgi:bifunctional DNase/RNase
LSHSVSQSHNYAVVMGEVDGPRKLPIVIGGFEAQAIAVALENMIPNRPLTHDLFKNTLTAFNINIKEVLINNLLDGIFFSKLICEKDGVEYSIDSRTSDAIALAVRFKAPIYTFDIILDAAGVVMDDPDIMASAREEENEPKKSEPKTLSSYSLAALQNMLEKAIENEDYEKAARIRDEIRKRDEAI